MSYKQTFLQFPRLGQSVDGSPLIRADLAVELAGDADKEIAALCAENAQLREQLAASEKLTAAYGQQERIACQVNVELTELLTATEKAATDFSARAEAEFERLRENLVADAEAMASHGSGTSADTIRDAFEAAHKRLMGGGA